MPLVFEHFVWVATAALLLGMLVLRLGVGVAGTLWGAVLLGASTAVITAGLAYRALELENFVEEFLRVLSQRTTLQRF